MSCLYVALLKKLSEHCVTLRHKPAISHSERIKLYAHLGTTREKYETKYKNNS